ALRTGLLSQRPSGTDPSFEAHNPALKCWATFIASLRDGIVFGSPKASRKAFGLGACRIYREAVAELSPGWSLCGTLGIEFSTLTALKERKKKGTWHRIIILK
ncbi:MAG TPA: hypothetical protein VHS80_16790, partial [Chthoniobacterales bacterium]|nr:hypothetical protein [Chthoniobacterales bacterium]